MIYIHSRATGEWEPAEPIGWREEHPAPVCAIYRVLGIGHCGKPGWRTGYQPGEAPSDRAVRELCEAIRLTVEYVGTEGLPPIEGWSWYDALRKYAPESAAQLKAWHETHYPERTR